MKDPKEKDRMLSLRSVTFPGVEEVKQQVEVVKMVQRIKKNSFMNGVNMNKMAKDMRKEMLSSKE